MAETSRFWNGTSTGDATEAPYDAPDEFAAVLNSLGGGAYMADRGGIFRGELNQLQVSGTSSPVTAASGRSLVHGTWYQQDASQTFAVPTPSASTRIDRIILRKSWASQTVRLVRLAGTEGGAAPTLTQSAGTTWEISLAQVSITTGGAITITDERAFIGFGNRDQKLFHINDFGGAGNNSTDNASAIAGANVSILAAGGGKMKFGKGTYLNSQILPWRTSNTTIEGEGIGQTIIKATANYAPTDVNGAGSGVVKTYANDLTDLVLRDLTIDHNCDATTPPGDTPTSFTVHTVFAVRVLIERVRVINPMRYQLMFQATYDVRVLGCQFAPGTTANYDQRDAIHFSVPRGGVVSGCIFDQSGTGADDCVACTTGDNGTWGDQGWISVSNCLVQGARQNVARIMLAEGGTCQNNTYTNITAQNIQGSFILCDVAGGGGGGTFKDITVMGNTINNVCVGNPTEYAVMSFGQGGSGTTCEGIMVSGNTVSGIVGASTRFLQVFYGRHITVGPNTVKDFNGAIGMEFFETVGFNITGGSYDWANTDDAGMDGILLWNSNNGTVIGVQQTGTTTGTTTGLAIIGTDGWFSANIIVSGCEFSAWDEGIFENGTVASNKYGINLFEGVTTNYTLVSGGGSTIEGALWSVTSWDPPDIPTDGAVTHTTVTVTGAATTDIVSATLSSILTNNVFINAHVEAANTVRVKLFNKTGGAINLGNGTLVLCCRKSPL